MNYLERSIVRDFGDETVKRLSLTQSGLALYANDPDAIHKFVGDTLTHEYGDDRIGEGATSRVYLFGDSGLCVKETNPNTYINHKRVLKGRSPLMPNLISEAIYMDAVARQLARFPRLGVKTPQYYAGIKTKNSSALLMSVVPERYVPVEVLHKVYTNDPSACRELDKKINQATRRTRLALGMTPLQLTAWELGWIKSAGNTLNIMMAPECVNESQGLDAYVIDLIGASKIQYFAARSIAKLVV